MLLPTLVKHFPPMSLRQIYLYRTNFSLMYFANIYVTKFRTKTVFSSYLWDMNKLFVKTISYLKLLCCYSVYYFDEEAAIMCHVPHPVPAAKSSFFIGMLRRWCRCKLASFYWKHRPSCCDDVKVVSVAAVHALVLSAVFLTMLLHPLSFWWRCCYGNNASRRCRCCCCDGVAVAVIDFCRSYSAETALSLPLLITVAVIAAQMLLLPLLMLLLLCC